jgi:coenzyme F420-0:L-glutamate ligase / coenzyme F420-1:gamma-L-glutamate ligase
MNIIPIKTTHIIKSHENLFEVLCESLFYNKINIQNNSIIVIAETLVATTQGRIFDLNSIKDISDKAKSLGLKYSLDPRLVQKILDESSQVFGGLPGILLTEKNGILIANSGIDKSNSGNNDQFSLWPDKPFDVCQKLLEKFKKKFNLSNFGIIISDSRVHPMRRGVVGVAIGVAGFHPIDDCRGRKDLYGHEMVFTSRALADQLSDAAHIVMGECDEQTPFVLIEDVPVEFTSMKIDPQSMLMPKNEDLFIQILKEYDENS